MADIGSINGPFLSRQSDPTLKEIQCQNISLFADPRCTQGPAVYFKAFAHDFIIRELDASITPKHKRMLL